MWFWLNRWIVSIISFSKAFGSKTHWDACPPNKYLIHWLRQKIVHCNFLWGCGAVVFTTRGCKPIRMYLCFTKTRYLMYLRKEPPCTVKTRQNTSSVKTPNKTSFFKRSPMYRQNTSKHVRTRQNTSRPVRIFGGKWRYRQNTSEHVNCIFEYLGTPVSLSTF